MKKPRWKLTGQEREIIAMALEGNPDPFTEYFLKGPNTGTWWFPGTERQPWKRGYALLHKYWLIHDRPTQFEYDFKVYTVWKRHERSDKYPNEPAFHNNHGLRLLPYGKEFFVDRTPTRTIIGGRGSGKTINIIIIPFLIWAAIYEEFRGFALAPEANQANEVLKVAWNMLQGTRYKDQFIRSDNYTRAPNALLRIENDLVGQTTIECYPLLKHEDKLLTLTGDVAAVDQAEKFENPRRILQDVGMCFRGRVVSTGRGRIGTLSLVANSDYNDELFQIYDMAEDDPDHYKSITLSSYNNHYLTDKDLENYETFAGNDEETIKVKLLGERPLGNGKEFSRDVLTRMKMPELDLKMQAGLAAQTPGYSLLKDERFGPFEWLLPYEEGHTYMVMSDPGTDNPPFRNSANIMVWDITEFPGRPATLAGFVWVYGNGEIKNWANKHAELTWRFKAINRNGFDATGQQSGYDEWIPIMTNLMSENMNLGGNGKANCLNAAKFLTSHDLMKLPPSLGALFNQLQRYELPEPKKLKQDLVLTFIMSAKWLERMWYMVIGPPQADAEPRGDIFDDRNERFLEDREGAYIR